MPVPPVTDVSVTHHILKGRPMIKASFELEKETKNTIRYTEKPEAGKPPVIGTIYIQKWALPEPTPQSITVTVEA